MSEPVGLINLKSDYEGTVMPWGSLILKNHLGQQLVCWSKEAIPFGDGKHYAAINLLYPRDIVFLEEKSMYTNQTLIERTKFRLAEQVVVHVDEHGYIYPVGSFWYGSDKKSIRKTLFQSVRSIAKVCSSPKRMIRVDPNLRPEYLVLIRFNEKPESGKDYVLYTIFGEEVQSNLENVRRSNRLKAISRDHNRLLEMLGSERKSDFDMLSA